MTTTPVSAPAAVSPAEIRQEARNKDWHRRLEGIAAGGRVPAAWLRAQRSAQRRGTLSAVRKSALDQHLPGWAATPHDRWLETAGDLVDFEDLHGALPTASGDDEERRLHRWLIYQRSRHAAGKLQKDRLKWLDKKLPGWTGEAPDHGG